MAGKTHFFRVEFYSKDVNYICVEDVNGKSAILTSSSDDVVIPDKIPLGNNDYNVTTIAEYAFENNKNITKAELPSTIKVVGAYAFQNCTNLEEVKLPSNLTNISTATFKGDNKLESITLSQNLEKIGDDAFSGCAGSRILLTAQLLNTHPKSISMPV